jgi:hypothetical protein
MEQHKKNEGLKIFNDLPSGDFETELIFFPGVVIGPL